MEYRSPRTLSYLALSGLAISGLCHFFTFLLGIAQTLAPGQSMSLPSGDKSNLWFLMEGLIALIQLPVYIFTVVVFLMWLFRVYKNLPALRADTTEFSPGWAVGWWFIPFANLVKPFQAVRDAWWDSDPDADVETGFLSSVKGGAPGFMSLWWGLWIVSNIVSNVTGRLVDSSLAGALEVVGYIFIIEGILWTVTAVLAVKVVREITSRQEMRFVNVLRLQSISEPPPPPTFDHQDPQF